jgi:hypothetical protein
VCLAELPPTRAISLVTRGADDLKLNSGLSDAGFAALAIAAKDCPCLLAITLGYNPHVGKAGLHTLASLLPRCSQLQLLSLNGNLGLGSEGMRMLAPALSECPCLAAVELMCCGICDAGAASLAVALAMCYELTTLDLRLNPLTNNGVGRLHAAWHKRTKGVHPRLAQMPQLAVLVDESAAQRPAADEHMLPYEFVDEDLRPSLRAST